MDKIIEILKKIKPNVDFGAQQNLIDSGILTSFDIIRLVAELNNEYDIEITPLYILPENFNSAQAILNLVNRLQEED